MKKILLLFTAIILVTTYANATGKIYAVIMGNTIDVKIGCKVDLDRFENELATLACNLDMDRVPTIRYDGQNCDSEHLEEGLNRLNACSREDIVFFYYSGHGGRAINDKTQWPQICLKYTDPNKFVPAYKIIDRISALPAHLKLVLTDCCNTKSPLISAKYINASARGASDVSEVNYESLAKLFIQQNGTIIATGSQIDEASLGGPSTGGAFTVSFWEAIEDAAFGNIQPTWKAVFEKTISNTRFKTENRQNPIYQLPTEGPSQSPVPSHSSNTNNFSVFVGNSNVSANLLQSVSQLLNRNMDISSRLRLISGIIQNHFTGATTARIQTVGRDMETIVDTEDVETFLRRITFDKKIRQINVIECKTYDGKCSYLKVHEVRDALQK